MLLHTLSTLDDLWEGGKRNAWEPKIRIKVFKKEQLQQIGNDTFLCPTQAAYTAVCQPNVACNLAH